MRVKAWTGVWQGDSFPDVLCWEIGAGVITDDNVQARQVWKSCGRLFFYR
jgi:hypothetical protein